MTQRYVDSHCHFDFETFDRDRSDVWKSCRDSGVQQMIVPGVTPTQWPGLAALSRQYSGLYYAVGVHPWWVDDVPTDSDQWCVALEDAAKDSHCVAIGECGLDSLRETPVPLQERLFERHLELANRLSMPLIIHSVKAHNPLLRLLKTHSPSRGGVIHAFSGSLSMAKEYWSLGFHLGVGGVITYQRARKTRETLRQMPLEALLLETDAPDMPLYGHQGERNNPTKLPDIAQTLASLREEPVDVIAEQTTANSRRLFDF